MKQTLTITKKELNAYFSSPMALIFIGVFLAATLFVFFWVDTFFARGIADVRPMFRWMPVLLIFLVSALTMRQWSEEEQSGSLEMLLTLPVSTWQLVLGKFLAVMSLVVIALALTLFLPLTVAVLGNLDWGPVIGGYIASILMAAAYASIGLFVSSRTPNQIVSLILSVLLSGLLYLIGSTGITEFAGKSAGNLLRALSVGYHFESIQRGVLDLRDMIYYLSLSGIFLAFNVLSVESKRWSKGEEARVYNRAAMLTVGLLVVNLIALNIWLAPLSGIRLDMTAQKAYSLSPTTRAILGNLQEPLLIRGYFSQKTHPLLAPLVPRIEDMLTEYAAASNGMVQVEFVDPAKDPELEAEANQTYGIRPVPFQVADRYQASVINSYFDILIRYGDQNETLNFRDLIDVEAHRDGQVDVRLRNLEYDLTRSIKKVVYGFQNLDAALAALPQNATLTLYVTPKTLPAPLADAVDTIKKVGQEIEANSQGKFTFQVVDPDAPNSPVNRQTLQDTYGLPAIPVSLFSPDSYYLHMLLQTGKQTQLIFPSGDMSEAAVRSAITSAIKRNTSGFLKVVGLWRPPQVPTQDMMGQMRPPFSSWETIVQQLEQDYEVRPLDLNTGYVPADVDALFVIAPQNMSDKQRFAVDQYLMRGGSVIIAAGNYGVDMDPFGNGLSLKPLTGGLGEMLKSYGIESQTSLVMDTQNEAFPVVVNRNLGGIQVQEIQAINYPFFVDVRPDGMAKDHPIVANLPAVTMQWGSPLTLENDKNAARTVSKLLNSSSNSWLRSDTNIQPDLQAYPETGFPIEGEQKSYLLAVAIQGSFESFFKDKESPLQASLEEEGSESAGPPPPADPAASVGVIKKSPQTARLVVIGSSEFLDDAVFDISRNLTRDRYLNNLQFAQNAVDWAVEDLDLLNIRARASQVQVLRPMPEKEQSFWEGLNYVLVLLALVVIGVIWYLRRRNEKEMELS